MLHLPLHQKISVLKLEIMNHQLNKKKDYNWLIIAILAISALTFGELFEQVVFVPNWLIGNVDENMEHFRKFKHTADPGMFYFPITIITIIAHLMLLRKASVLTSIQKKAVKISLTLFAIVFALTIYVIVMINIPVIDNGILAGEAQKAKIQLWAVLNVFRFVLPAYGLYQLLSLVKLDTK